MVTAKIISSLDKCFTDMKPADFAPFSSSYVYRNQILSLQIAVYGDPRDGFLTWNSISVTGIESECIRIRTVELIPSALPAYPGKTDSGYIRTTPGLYPDILAETHAGGLIPAIAGQLRAVWVDIDMNKHKDDSKEVTVLPLSFIIKNGAQEIELPFTLKLIPASLPDHGMKVTQWFYTDCLANYYHVEVFSEEHWRIIGNFMRSFAADGNNMILTPVLTPALDTHVGGERLTTQLTGIKLGKNGRYYFDFTLLDRWIDTALRSGIKYFEISHFFTQWGAAHAPKVMAETPDGYRRIFGWDTDATGSEYKKFLRSFVKALLEHLKARGVDKICYFHISDEPQPAVLEQYMKSKAVVADLLEGYHIMDALSNIAFYNSGAVKDPIPSNNHIEPFIEQFEKEGRTDLWTYYCCGQNVDVSNRLVAMYGARTRYIGLQFWKYRIAGFLQWGFNFYNNCGSYDAINPFLDSNGNYWVPSGDTCSVYPAQDGTALDSMRILQFREGLGDVSALKLLESLIGREATLKAVEELTGNIVFNKCEYESAKMLAIRERIDSLVAENLG